MGSRRETENVLVTAAGTIVAQGIMKGLRLANRGNGSIKYRIVATDMSPQGVGLYRADLGLLVPPAKSEDFVNSLVKICREEQIRAVFVGSEEELQVLSENGKRIEEETGAKILVDSVALAIGSDKFRTFQFLRENKLPCALSALPDDQPFVREHGFPLVVKPREGHGSLHFYLVHDQQELERSVLAIVRAGWRPMLQEYLPNEGEEYTSGVTIDREGSHVMSSISMRRTMKGGQTFKAFVDDFVEIRTSAEEVALKMGARGPVNIQARVSGDEPKVFEINPRFSASTAIRAAAGVNEPDIVFRNWVLGEQIKLKGYRKLVCLRYFNEVFVPESTYEGLVREGRVELGASSTPDYF
jgi:carbamoyl-phosphate synthase large subunit